MTEPQRLLLVDLLYLAVAAGLGLWFRAWLRHQQRAMDDRLARMEATQAQLERLGERLQGVCRGLEGVFTRLAREGDAPVEASTHGRPGTRGRARPDSQRGAIAEEVARQGAPSRAVVRREEAYSRARELLRQGVLPAEVARRVGLGIAEVNVLRRMQGS